MAEYKGARILIAEESQIKNIEIALEGISYEHEWLGKVQLKLSGMYQIENSNLAIIVCKEVLHIPTEIIVKGIKKTTWPGRFEVVSKKPLVILDAGQLERFLDEVFAHAPLPISLKTRLGVEDPQEFIRLLDIYNRYPVKLLIVHPRVRKDFYDGPLQTELFHYALDHSKNPLCFNGNLTSRDQLDAFSKTFPGVPAVMVGRGLIGNPALLYAQNAAPDTLERFCDELLAQYIEAFGGSRNAMFRLKENWRYLLCLFRDTDKLGKQLRKTTDIAQYRAITHEIFRTCTMKPELTPDW